MRLLPVLLIAAWPLAACTPTSGVTTQPAAGTEPARETAAEVVEGTPPAPLPAPEAPLPRPPAPSTVPKEDGATLTGAIRDGNRPPPALRICAHPVAGGTPTCMASPAGATAYRLDVQPGRYHVMGWVEGGELALIAHATQIRCIRAPCPPDELIVVEVAAGEHAAGIDLGAGYAEVPAGWPTRP